jgi:PAS domain S-box-containing protein
VAATIYRVRHIGLKERSMNGIMTTDLKQFTETNPNPVLCVANDCTVLYSNKAGEPLLHQWDVTVGEKLPSYIGDIVKNVISLNRPEKIEIKVGKKVYWVAFHPSSEGKCVNIYGLDISDWREFEEKHPGSEAQEEANLELADILDIPAIQSLMDDLYELTHITIALVDLKGNIPAIAGRQEICSRFHRVHPETCKYCVESDTKLSLGVAPGEFKLYKCKNNMWDVATPLIVGGQHIGNIFSGHFFFEDEPLEYELFQSQAKKYGFNEEEYIAALEKVPRLSREAVNKNMSFFMKLANMISQLSHSNFKISRSLVECDILVDKLEKNREDFDRAQAVGNIGSWRLDVRKNELTWSDENHRIFGIQKGTPLTYETFLSTVHPDDREYVDRKWKAGLKGEPYDIEHRIVVDGMIKWVREKAYIEFDNDGAMIGGFGITQDITERKKSEEALKKAHDSLEAKVKERTSELEKAYESLMEEERRLSEAQKIAHIGNWNWNLVTGEVCWSDELYRIFGRSPQESGATYGEFLNYVHPDDRDRVNNAIEKGLNGEPIAGDYRIVLANGEERIVHTEIEVVFYEGNNPIQVKGTIQDITEIKRVEEQIKILANIVESSNDAIGTISLDGNITSWNQEAENVYGYSVKEVLGKPVSILAPPHLEKETIKLIEEIKHGKKVQHYETLRLRKDGITIYVSITLSPVFDSYGKLIAISFISRNITERKKIEEKLRESEEKYRNIVETANEGISIIDAEERITFVNKKIEDMFGYSSEEFIGRPMWDFLSDESKAIIKQMLEKGWKNVNESFEIKFIHKDGYPVWTHTNSKSLFDKDGKFFGTLNLHTDITKRKEAEETLRNFEIARKKEIHHRIKNNLQVIYSLLDLQSEKFRSRGCAEDVEVLNAFRESKDRVMSIAFIHEELHEGRGTDTLDFSAYLERLIENLFQTYKLGNVNTSLNVELEENVFFDMDIAVPLGIIINELVSNSLKYAFLGRDNGKIEIKLYREDSAEHANKEQESIKESYNGTDFILVVSDNGIGIPEEFSLEDSSSLGLQLVEILVDQLGGEVELKRGSGTEFVIRFTVPIQN